MNTNLPFHDLISTHVPTSPLCYYFTALVCIHDRHDSLHVIINVFYSVNSSTLGIKTNLTAGNIQSPRPRLAGFTWRHRKHYGPGRLRDAGLGETYVDGLAWKWRFYLGSILTINTYHREHYITTICCASLAAYLALSLSHTGPDMS